jgi:hypothetical protein
MFARCRMGLIARLLRHHHELPIANAALRDDVIGHVLHVIGSAFQHSDFKTGFDVQMHMQRGNRQVMMVMKFVREAIGQIAPAVVWDCPASVRAPELRHQTPRMRSSRTKDSP